MLAIGIMLAALDAVLAQVLCVAMMTMCLVSLLTMPRWSVHSTRRRSMLHHKEAHQASYHDISEAAMCTKETAKC